MGYFNNILVRESPFGIVDYGYENRIVSKEELERENADHGGNKERREETVIISWDAGSDIDEDCAELIIKSEQAEFREFYENYPGEVGRIDMCIEEEAMAIKTNEDIIRGNKMQEEIPHNEQCNSKTEADKLKDNKVIKYMKLSDNESDDECEKLQHVKSDQFGDQNVDIDIDCAKYVQDKGKFKIDVFPKTLVNINVFDKQVKGTQGHGDSDSNSISYEANLEQIRYTDLNICDIETISEKHANEEDINPTEKDVNEERECTKDKPIFDAEVENSLEGDVKEYSTQPITITAVSSNVDYRKINEQSLYKIRHRQHVYLNF